MRLKEAGPRPADPSNAYEQRTEAAAFGRRPLQRHAPEQQRPGGVRQLPCGRQAVPGRQAVRPGRRHRQRPHDAGHGRGAFAPSCSGTAARTASGRRRSGPLEDAAEHGGNRVRFVRLVQSHYRADTRRRSARCPPSAGCRTMRRPPAREAERAAWAAMPEPARDAVNRVFANMGKAIAAFERNLSYGESRFDRYAQATVSRRRARPGGAHAAGGPGAARCSSPRASASAATTARC